MSGVATGLLQPVQHRLKRFDALLYLDLEWYLNFSLFFYIFYSFISSSFQKQDDVVAATVVTTLSWLVFSCQYPWYILLYSVSFSGSWFSSYNKKMGYLQKKQHDQDPLSPCKRGFCLSWMLGVLCVWCIGDIAACPALKSALLVLMRRRALGDPSIHSLLIRFDGSLNCQAHCADAEWAASTQRDPSVVTRRLSLCHRTAAHEPHVSLGQTCIE